MRHPGRAVSTLLAVVILALAPACGGGGGGGGGGPTQPPAPTGITFTPSGSAASNSVYLSEGAQTHFDRLFLEVRVNDVDELYGVAFDLTYPSQQLAFVRATEGNFFKGSTSLQVAEKTNGTIIVGHTNLGDDQPESGSGLLMTLEFTPITNGTGAITFANAQAFGRGSVPKSVNFLGGNVRVNR